jgi:hypothetical protein
MSGVLRHLDMVRCEAQLCSSLFPPYADTCVPLRRGFHVARELTLIL